MFRIPFTIALGFSASSLSATALVIDLRDPSGAPLADAVVSVDVGSRSPTARPVPIAKYEVVQQNIRFQPGVLVVPLGATVAFPNRDAVRHHVYSVSKPKKFDLKLYGREQARTVMFDKTGTVSLGCNIHDAMRGSIRVVDTPYAGKSDARGRVTIPDLPPGAATMTVWHAGARAKDQEARFTIALPASGTLSRTITVPIRTR